MSQGRPPEVAAATTAPRPYPLSPYARLTAHLGVRRLSALLEELAGRLDDSPDGTVVVSVSRSSIQARTLARGRVSNHSPFVAWEWLCANGCSRLKAIGDRFRAELRAALARTA